MPLCKLIYLQADKHKVPTTVTKIRDYNRHGSNNINPCLLCVDETGIRTNPICFESRLSACLNMPALVWPSCGSLEQRLGFQLQLLNTESEITKEEGSSKVPFSVQLQWLYHHMFSPRSCPALIPHCHFSPLCQCCPSNPLPLLPWQIWLLLLLLWAGLKD